MLCYPIRDNIRISMKLVILSCFMLKLSFPGEKDTCFYPYSIMTPGFLAGFVENQTKKQIHDPQCIIFSLGSLV